MKWNVSLTGITTISTVFAMFLVAAYSPYWWLYTLDYSINGFACYFMVGANRKLFLEKMLCLTLGPATSVLSPMGMNNDAELAYGHRKKYHNHNNHSHNNYCAKYLNAGESNFGHGISLQSSNANVINPISNSSNIININESISTVSRSGSMIGTNTSARDQTGQNYNMGNNNNAPPQCTSLSNILRRLGYY